MNDTLMTLTRPWQSYSFVSRERRGGRLLANKCGRDFLYYALQHYYPERFNAEVVVPAELEAAGFFGYPVPSWLAWSQVQYWRTPARLAELGLFWQINDRTVRGPSSLAWALLGTPLSYEAAVTRIEAGVAANEAIGIDIALGWGGLLDHVLFVHGFDAEAFYVFDTHEVAGLEYEPIEPQAYYRLPRQVAAQRWTRCGRVWRIGRHANRTSTNRVLYCSDDRDLSRPARTKCR